MDEDSCSVRVVVRFRPTNERERKEGESRNYTLKITDDCRIELADQPPFTFDRVFAPGCAQGIVYEYTAKQTIDDVLNGYNGTIFAYGQTGSGKTFTMFGPDVIETEDDKGIVPRASNHIFNAIRSDSREIQYSIKASFLEIYKENIRDLLNPSAKNLAVRESTSKGVFVEHLTEEFVSSEEDIAELIKQGESSRSVSATKMNQRSSRSHSLFIITIEQKNIQDDSIKVGRLNLIDLAGSEKVGKTGATGNTLEEAKKINQSLSALGNCIHALTESKRGHIPYRDSKLTRILQESLGGNTKTTLVITASPHVFNAEETLGSLRFGARAKTIKNKVSQNVKRSVDELMAIINTLKGELVRMKMYCSSLERHLRGVQTGLVSADSPLPIISKKEFEEEEAKNKGKSLENGSSDKGGSSSSSSNSVNLSSTVTPASAPSTPVESKSTTTKKVETKKTETPTKTDKKTTSTTSTPTASSKTSKSTTSVVKTSKSTTASPAESKTASKTKTTSTSSTKSTRTKMPTAATKTTTPSKTTTTTKTSTPTATPTKSTGVVIRATRQVSTPTKPTTPSSAPSLVLADAKKTIAKAPLLDSPIKSIPVPLDDFDFDPISFAENKLKEQKENEKINFQLEKSQEKIDELENLLKKKEKDLKKIQEDFGNTSKKLTETERDLKSKHIQWNNKEQELNNLHSHYKILAENLEKQNLETKRIYAEVKSSFEEKMIELKSLQENKVKIQQENENLSKNNFENQLIIENLNKKVSLLNNNIVNLEEKIEKAEKNLLNAENSRDELNIENKLLISNKKEIEQQVEELNEKLNELNKNSELQLLEIQKLNFQIKLTEPNADTASILKEFEEFKNTQVLNFQNQIEKLKNENNFEKSERNQLNFKAKLTEENLENYKNKLNSSLENLLAAEKVKENLNVNFQELENKLASLEKIYNEKIKQSNLLQEQNTELQLKISQIQFSLDSQKNSLVELLNENSILKSQINDENLRNKNLLNEQKVILSGLEEKVDGLTEENEQINQKLNTSLEENKMLKLEIEKYKKALDDAESRRSRVFRPVSVLSIREKPMEQTIDYISVRAQLRPTNSPFLKNLA